MNYNNKVLTGNWAEERLETTFKSMMFLRRRENRLLLLQKARTLFSNLLKEVDIATGMSTAVYGNPVQVIASDMLASKTKFGEEYGLALSSLVLPRQVDNVQNMADGCIMTLSPIKRACCRNTFIICGNDDSDNGNSVNYGDEFFLKAVNADPEAAPLYVGFSPNPIPETKGRMPIHLSRTKNRNCRWVALPLNGKERLGKLGFPIESRAKVVINNTITYRPLFVMNQNWMQTFFGVECGITCQTAVDQLRRNRAENAFTFIIE